MPRTLVTGAAGFIGSHVAARLLQRGDDVLAVIGPGATGERLAGLDLRRDEVDVTDRRAVRRVMRDVDRVFHTAGMTSLTASRENVYAINVEGTRIVLEEALRAGVERAVLTSSVAAIGPARPGRIANEANRFAAGRYGIPYLDSKVEAEAIARRLHERGLPVVIVNPAWTMGAGGYDSTATSLVRRFLRREIPAYTDGTLNIVGVDDVARGHVLAEARGVPGMRYILGNRNFTMARLLADLGRLSGVEPPAVRLPTAVAVGLSSVVGRTPLPLRLPTPMEIRVASLNWGFSNAKAKRELGWTVSPHEECLEETIAWYREREGQALATVPRRQPLPFRITGSLLRRMPF